MRLSGSLKGEVSDLPREQHANKLPTKLQRVVGSSQQGEDKGGGKKKKKKKKVMKMKKKMKIRKKKKTEYLEKNTGTASLGSSKLV